jgi:hypothetical protein
MATSEIGIKIGLQGAESVTSGLQRVGVSMGQLSGQVDTVRNALSTLAPTLAGALTVGGLVAFVRQTVNAVDAMNDLVDATGASIEEISKLDQVARRNGASLDQVGGMLVKFNAQLKAADGKNGASIALEAIGLSAAKLRQLDPAEALRQTAVALAGFENDANKARITQELFGKSVREAAPFLNDLAEAGQLNASVTKEQAAEAERFNKQMSMLGANVTDAARALVSDLLPALNDTLSTFMKFSANGGVLSGFFTLLVSQFKDARIQATLEEIARLEGRLSNPNVTGFNRSTLQKELSDATNQLRELQGEAVKARTALDAALGGPNLRAREDRGFVPGLRSAGDIAADEARRKAAEQASVAAAKALDDEAKAIGEAIKQRERYLETLSAGTDKIAKETQALADQVAQVVLGKQAFQDIIDAREEEQAVILETQAIRALDRNLDAKEFDSLKAQAQAIRDRINARKALATATVEATDREIMARRSAFKDQDAQEIIDTERLKNSQSIIDAINRETEALQMSKVEREVTIALLAAEARGIKAGSYEYEEYAKNIRAAIVNRETVRASIEQTKTIEQEWRRTADQIGQSLTDALMQGGKSAWEYIKGLFRSMVLRPIIQAAVNPLVGSLGGGGGGALSTLGSINSLATLGSVITGSVASSIGNVMGTAGTLFGSSALTSFAAGMKGATLAPGLMGPTTVGASGAMGAGASAAAAIPYVAAALAVANALGVFRSRSIVGGGLTGTLGMGDIQSYDLQRRGGTLFSGPEYSMVNRQTSTESAAIQSAFEALRTNAASMAEALGLSSTAVKSFTTTLGTDITQNDIGTRGIKLDGLTPEQAAKKVEEALAAANEDLAAFVLGASRTVTESITTTVEDWENTEGGTVLRGYLTQVSEVTRTIEASGTSYARAGETNVQTLTRLAGSLSTINPALELLGLNLYATSLAGADLASQLADAFGGLENFTQASAAYYAEFFTEAERTAKTTAQLTEALGGLGLALPTTRDAYRQLVEAQDLTTEAGRKNFAVLVQLSGTFAGITPVVEDLAEASDQATEALRSAADILRERQGLERQLLQLQGDTAALRALDRAALDESNRALFDRITALQDSQAAEAAAAEATRTAAAAAEEAARAAAAETQRIGQERLGLERQLLQLQGATATIRALERAALDESNRALFDRITALQDSQAAEAAAAEATRTAAAAAQEAARAAHAEAQRIGQERLGLERQLLQLQGNTAAIRALERGALENSNRALFDYVTALQDAQAAAAAMEASERTLADLRAQAAQEALANKQRLAQDATAATNAAFDAVRRAIDAQAAAAEAAIRSAFDLQMRNINAQKTAAEAAKQVAQETLQSARPLFDFLGKQVQELSGLAGFGMSGAQGRRFVQDALTSLRATGTLPNEDRLQEAVQAARRELDLSRYSSAAELRRDTLLLANSLAELQSATGQQLSSAERALSIAEQQLKAQEEAARVAQEQLDAQLDATRVNAASQLSIAQAQLNALRSIDTGVVSVSEAMSRLGAAIAAETVATAQANQALTAAVLAAAQANATAAESAANIARANAATLAAANAAVQAAASIAAAAQPVRSTTARTLEDVTAMLPENWFTNYTADQKIDWFNENKVTIAELTEYERRQGTSERDIRANLDWILANGYRGFAEGGLHTGGLRLVGERGPELEVTGPARYWSFEQTNAMLSGGYAQERRMIAQLEALRAEMEGLRAEARSTAVATNKTARILDRVTPDGTSLQTVAAT